LAAARETAVTAGLSFSNVEVKSSDLKVETSSKSGE
jgi:hypothetical protein